MSGDPDIILDVSRLVWRSWRGGLPTGIDRVCLAYAEHYSGRARAMVQRKAARFVLSRKDSDRLFAFLLKGRAASPLDWVKMAASLLPSVLRQESFQSAIYLNVGHTGLDEASLPAWLEHHQLRPVYMVHDLIPLSHPQFCRVGESEKHSRRMENVVATATGIIGNSETTLGELEQFAASRGRFLPATLAALIAGHQPPLDPPLPSLARPYFITLGTIEGRKNHLMLLRCWQRLLRKHGTAAPRLVIVGQRGWEADEAFAILDNLGELDGNVIEMGDCDDDRLASLIAGARALLMPSFVEGFGLPIIEALQLSTPVIASDLPVYREIAGSVPTYLDPADEDGWISRIWEFTHDSPERGRQMLAMPDYRAPAWPEHFRKVEAWLATL